jgi:hypothetical protein
MICSETTTPLQARQLSGETYRWIFHTLPGSIRRIGVAASPQDIKKNTRTTKPMVW